MSPYSRCEGSSPSHFPVEPVFLFGPQREAFGCCSQHPQRIDSAGRRGIRLPLSSAAFACAKTVGLSDYTAASRSRLRTVRWLRAGSRCLGFCRIYTAWQKGLQQHVNTAGHSQDAPGQSALWKGKEEQFSSFSVGVILPVTLGLHAQCKHSQTSSLGACCCF